LLLLALCSTLFALLPLSRFVVVVLVTALGIFSSVYRRRKAGESNVHFFGSSPSTSLPPSPSLTSFRIFPSPPAASVDLPWFPSHPTRDSYIALLQQSPPPPESIIKSALLFRAMADVRRILKLREDKTAHANLIQKGSIGDDLLVKFAKAEKELEAEVLDVVNEANSFTGAWGPGIFQTAQEMVMMQADIKIKDEIPAIHKEQGESNRSARCTPRSLRKRGEEGKEREETREAHLSLLSLFFFFLSHSTGRIQAPQQRKETSSSLHLRIDILSQHSCQRISSSDSIAHPSFQHPRSLAFAQLETYFAESVAFSSGIGEG